MRSCLLDDATEYRVDVAVSHAHAMLGYSLAGLRRFDEAHEQLDDAASSRPRRQRSVRRAQRVRTDVSRVMLEEGRAAEACAIEPPDARTRSRGCAARFLRHGLLRSRRSDVLSEAVELGSEAASTDAGRRDQSALASRSRRSLPSSRATRTSSTALKSLVTVAFEAGAVDLLVCAYRANPDLLATLLTAPSCVERTCTRSRELETTTSRPRWASRSQAASIRAQRSRLASERFTTWSALGSRTVRSPRSCSSARQPSRFTFTTCSTSLASDREPRSR